MAIVPVALPPSNDRSIATGPCLTVRFRRMSVPFSDCCRVDGFAHRHLRRLGNDPRASLFLELASGSSATSTGHPSRSSRCKLRCPALQIDCRLRSGDRRRIDLLRQRDDLGIDRDLLQTCRHFRLHVLLVPAVEMLREELLGGGEHRHVVHRPRKPVAFVGRHDVLDREPAIAERDDDLVRLGFASRADRWRPGRPGAAS